MSKKISAASAAAAASGLAVTVPVDGVDVTIAAAAPVSFAQFCRDNGLNPKTARAKLRRYQVSKTVNNSRNYATDALTVLNAELAAKRAAS